MSHPTWITVLLLMSVGWSASAADREIDFGRDIRPILSDKCFQCHGADKDARQAELRLDLRASAVGTAEEPGAIVPGNVDESELVRRISSTDEYEQMPPADSNKSLTPEQIELLKEWVKQDAPYEKHWAFEPIERQVPPAVKRAEWVRNEIDAFVLRRLEQRGLAPSPEADRATLVRRVYQDLLGLLPTPEEAEAFVRDPDPRAYEKLVDRLLQSPHYGERWGRHWLDQARYADSHGYTIDGARVMWPYRDWVIKSLNDDLPFDEFTIAQLAGDLLESPTKEQLIATAFHRNTMINQEGGVKPDQYRHEAVLDRANTTGSVWLGLTVGCAQCHTHKFDPITHNEYYSFYAFFNDCADANNTGPTVPVHQGEVFGLTPERQAELDELAALKKRLAELEKAAKKSDAALAAVDWQWKPVDLDDYRTASNATFKKLPGDTLLTDGKASDNDTYIISFKPRVSELTAIRLRVLPHESLPKGGPGTAGNGNFVLTDIELQIDGNPVRFADGVADHEQPGYPVGHAIDGEAKTGWAINVDAEQTKKNPELKMNAPHEAILTFAAPVAVPADRPVTLVLKHDTNQNYLIGHLALDQSTVAVSKSDAPESQELAEAKQRVAELERRLPNKGQPVSQMIVRRQEQPSETYRLIRGDFLRPDKESGALRPGVPQVLLPDGSTRTFQTRLDLARWLMGDENPLTARVIVNRIWMRYFGRGLVETENDFGYQGTPPSHPELLDWLAAEFRGREPGRVAPQGDGSAGVEPGRVAPNGASDNPQSAIRNPQSWSLKHLHRLIVLSATYRQASDYREDLAKVDMANELLGRQLRFRVEGEIVRDMALAASGRLVRELGGPSVHPPQPDGVYSFTQTKKDWPEAQGPDRYRRTLYTMFYRSAPYPLLTTFDAPDFSTVCTHRVRSNTPLQSLTMANDEVFFELAQALAARVLSETPESASLDERLTQMFRRCLTRPPTAAERDLLAGYWRQEQARYEEHAAAAAEVAPKEFPEGTSPAAAAAWTSLARALMNTDEFVTRN